MLIERKEDITKLLPRVEERSGVGAWCDRRREGRVLWQECLALRNEGWCSRLWRESSKDVTHYSNIGNDLVSFHLL